MKSLFALAFVFVFTTVLADVVPTDNITGCRTPGGTIIHIAEGDEPLQRCSPAHTEITWNETGQDGMDGQDGQDGMDGQDGQDGMDGVSGYEVVEAIKLVTTGWPPGEARVLVANCPDGKNVIGGGVRAPFSSIPGVDFAVVDSNPQPQTYTSWFTRVLHIGFEDPGDTTLFYAAFAICANITDVN